VNRAVAGVELAVGRFDREHRLRLAGVHRRTARGVPADIMIAATHWPAALVVMVMATEHQIDAVAVEQRQPGLANSPVGAIAVLRGAERILMHLHDDPVDALIL